MKIEGNLILKWTALFYCLFSIWALFNLRELMSNYMLILSFLISLSYFVAIGFSVRVSSRKNILLWCLGIAFNIFWLIQLKEIYLLEIGRFFGGGMDIKYYERITIQNIDTSILDFKEVLSRDISFDDWGFFSLIYLVYSFIGSVEGGRIAMIIANTFAIILSSIYLYKILKILEYSQSSISFIVSLFLFSPFNIIITSVGLKENFFVLLIILSIHSIIGFSKEKEIKKFYLALVFASFCLLFRAPVAVILLITLILSSVITERNKNTMIRLAVGGIILSLPFFGLIIQSVFGISLERILSITNNRFNNMGNTEIGWSVNLLGALIGPFPNFTRSDTYGIYYSATLLLKTFLGAYFYLGIYRAWKLKHTLHITLIMYWLFNCIMYVLAGVGLDYRYHMTVFPIWLCFTALGLDYYSEHKKQTYKYFILLYIFLVLIITLFYNTRGVVLN